MSHRVRFVALMIAVCVAFQHGAADAQTAAQVSSISVSPTTVIGGTTATGTVTLTRADLSGSFSVRLTSNNAAAQVGTTVAVPMGLRSATFEIRTSPVGSQTRVDIGASGGGAEASAALTVNPPSISAVTLPVAELVGGGTVTGTIRISGPAASTPNPGAAPGFGVPLSSNNGHATVPAFVVVPAGQTSATFDVTTNRLNVPETATITAGQGAGSRTATLNLKLLGIDTLKLSAPSVFPGQPVTATVELNAPVGPSQRGFFFTVAGSPPVVQLPGSANAVFEVPSGQKSATFQVHAGPVARSTPAIISVDENNRVGPTPPRTAPLTVNPPEVASVSVSVDRPGFSFKRFPGGGVSSDFGTNASLLIGLTGPAPNDFTMALSSSSSTVTVPATINATGGASAQLILQTQAVEKDTEVGVTVTTANVAKSGRFVLVPPTARSILCGGSAAARQVVGGETVAGCRVRLNALAPAGGIGIPLSSSMRGAVPDAVKVVAGGDSEPFSIVTTPVATSTPVTISSGPILLETGGLTVSPPSVVNLLLSSGTVAGGTEVIASITLNGAAPAGDLNVPLSSSNINAATVPATARIPAGQNTGSFPITTLEVPNDTSVTITAGATGAARTTPLVVRAGR